MIVVHRELIRADQILDADRTMLKATWNALRKGSCRRLSAELSGAGPVFRKRPVIPGFSSRRQPIVEAEVARDVATAHRGG